MQDIALIETDFVPPGTVLRVEVLGFPPLAVVNVEGQFFVCDDTCSHGQASLSDGVVEGHAHAALAPGHGGRRRQRARQRVHRHARAGAGTSVRPAVCFAEAAVQMHNRLHTTQA